MASNTTTIVMSSAIEEVLDILHRSTERPRQCAVTAAASASDTSLTVDTTSAGLLTPTDVLEFGRERMLVTGVASTTVTVSRGYAGSTPATLANGAVGLINPLYPRSEIDLAIRRCFNLLETHLPAIESETLYPISEDSPLRPLDERAMKVLRCEYWDGKNVAPVKGRWEFKDWLPDEISYTGKALVAPTGYWHLPLLVTYQVPYAWTGAGDGATIAITVGGDDLPVEYAVARLQTGREVSRQEFDQIEEWSQVEANRRGQNIRLLQTLWGRFFQRLDEVKSTQTKPKHVHYQRMHYRL